MSSLKTEALLREFQYNGVRIPDPGPELTVDQVRDLLTPAYPEIATTRTAGTYRLNKSYSRLPMAPHPINPTFIMSLTRFVVPGLGPT